MAARKKSWRPRGQTLKVLLSAWVGVVDADWRFISYGTLSIAGDLVSESKGVTAAGLRVPEELPKVRFGYMEAASSASSAWGGSWLAKTPDGPSTVLVPKFSSLHRPP